MKPLLHVANMIYNRPLAILPDKLETILHAIGPRLTGELISAENPILSLEPFPPPQPKNDKGYRLTPEGIAIIPISGTLMKRFGFLSAASGCSSYESVENTVAAALGDAAVKAVLLDCDSPGGTTHGCFECAESIFEMRQQSDKPLWAISNDLAASAAYALASAASRILVTRTAGVGSIGVFALQIDQSALDEQQGLKYNYVYAGSKKTDGNPHEPLSKSARADLQAEVDREYDMFVETVARNRNAPAGKIRATQAGVLYGEKSLGLLADGVASCDETLAELTDLLKKGAKIPVATYSTTRNNAFNPKAAPLPDVTSQKNPKQDGKGPTFSTFLAGQVQLALNSDDSSLRAAVLEELQNVLAAKAEESTTPQGESDMTRRQAKADADEEMDAKLLAAAKKEEVDEDNDTDTDDDPDFDDADDDDADKKKKSTKSTATAVKDTKSTKTTKSRKQDDVDDDDDVDGRRVRLPRVANGAAITIARLCTMQGVPELAATYIAAGYDVDRCIQELSERRAEESRKSGDGLRSYVTGTGTGGGVPSIDQAIAQANAAAANDPNPQAARYKHMQRILQANPEIYEAYLDARDRVIQACPSGRGKALNDFVLVEQRRYMKQLNLSTVIDDVPTRRSMV